MTDEKPPDLDQIEPPDLPQIDREDLLSMRWRRAIARRRRALALTQEELAARLGVHRVTVAKWEAGMLIPEIDRLPAIAEALEIDGEVLFAWSERPEPEPPATEETDVAPEAPEMPPDAWIPINRYR